MRDTLYTTDSIYLEVDLTRQNVTVHSRDGKSRTFPISSDTPYISEGMATPTGIFTLWRRLIP
ncbi:MAG: L,D-transpeptidase [Chlorobi bacterium]|nr:L,D-transpeptidase [Chlorobiota bacterium]